MSEFLRVVTRSGDRREEGIAEGRGPFEAVEVIGGAVKAPPEGSAQQFFQANERGQKKSSNLRQRKDAIENFQTETWAGCIM